MKKTIVATVALAVLAIFVSSAQAIDISQASVKGGLAVVHGNKAAKQATITWEGANVTQTNNGGAFSFSGVVPADCVGTLSDGVATIDVALANCTPTPAPAGGVLKTGQTTCYETSAYDGTPVPCGGTGQDGELQKGTARSYTSNADGTITDNSTGLMWEKLTSDGSIHDTININSYQYAGAFGKIAILNTMCFAGHCDWRLPNINELQTLVDYGRTSPAINPVFNNGSDSFTNINYPYWSSTAADYQSINAWFVHFYSGFSQVNGKNNFWFVRAVRGGF